MNDKDFLYLHLLDLPYFRALVRAVEATFYQTLDLPSPTLDVGCGDGHFATLTFDQKIDVGLDPWSSLRRPRNVDSNQGSHFTNSKYIERLENTGVRISWMGVDVPVCDILSLNKLGTLI